MESTKFGEVRKDLKIKGIPFNHLLVTSDYTEVKKKSDIILPDDVKARAMKDIQTVVAKGPLVPDWINVGDKVLIDTRKFVAKRENKEYAVHLLHYGFSKEGELLTEGDSETTEHESFVQITDREVLMVLP